jgi:phosphohistidine phosphatase
MRLYIMRHGIAIGSDDPGAPAEDGDRPLTAEGVERTRAALQGLISFGAVVDRVVASPLLRCTQTAQLASEVLGVPRFSLETHTGLAPGADFAELIEGLRRLPDDGVLVIGHSPDVDLLSAALLGLPNPITSLKKAGLLILQLRTGQPLAKLVGVYEPKVLRRLGRTE